jgi:tetratricopeptide (TPR) repeat protein
MFARQMAYFLFENLVATIALRDYLSGIEELIDQGQTDEALAHCRHVLESFPKHIDTYRLMAKAYLEARRHAEASDIFQRVLSSVPDDFVAHIGMSIIREESSDQDGAIWHMERAFEAQPSNRAVQDELRRLYGKREGYAPPKVRLTRGALARMYAHGDLYNQSIGELRSALGEDAERPDLQVLMAEMLFRTNRQTDAIDACSKLIEKYPYCLIANRIMAEILTAGNRAIEAQPYVDRVVELDPYAAQVSGLAAASDAAADSVTLEQLILSGPASDDQQLPKAWTGTLEEPRNSANFVKEDLPDWLSIDAFEQSGETADETQPSETEPSVLGALESLGPQTGSLSKFEEEAPKDEERRKSDTQPAFISRNPSTALVDDQIPEWLRELRPATSSLSLPKELQDPSAGSEPLAEPEPAADAGLRTSQPRWTEEFKTAGLDRSQLPAELEEPEAQANEEPQAKNEDDSLSWLENLAAESAAADAAKAPVAEKSPRETPPTPSWLTEPETKPVAPQSKTDVLAWLDDLKTEADAGPESESDTKPQSFESDASGWQPEAMQREASEEETTPAWPQEIPSLEESSGEESSGERTVPAWLKGLSSEVEQIGGSKTGEISPRQLDEAPDWLSDLRQDEPSSFVTAEPEAESELELEASADEEAGEPEETWQASDLSKLDWLEELAPKPAESSADSQRETEAIFAEESSAFETYHLPVDNELTGFELEAEETAEPEPAPVAEQNFVPAAVEPVQAGSRLKVKAKAPATQAEAEQRLEQARQALNYNKPEDAATHYGYLLQRRQMLDEVVADLSAAVRRSPSDATLWQTLGDAYMRNNQLREALDSYRRAEDLL